MQDNEIVLLKLSTNVDIIGKLVNMYVADNIGVLQLDRVVEIVPEQGLLPAEFKPFMPYSENTIMLHRTAIVAIGDVVPSVLDKYNEYCAI